MGYLSERPVQILGLFCVILERTGEASVVLDCVLSGSRDLLLVGYLNHLYQGGKRNKVRLELSLMKKEEPLASADRQGCSCISGLFPHIHVLIMFHYCPREPLSESNFVLPDLCSQEPPGPGWLVVTRPAVWTILLSLSQYTTRSTNCKRTHYLLTQV